jgi:MarR family transcriptional regulator, organic hydroperoxide resistance regulator
MNKLDFCRALFEESRYMNIVLKAALAVVVERHGLSHVQALLLGDLRSEDGQSISQLADHVSVKPSNFTPLARSLEEMGLIERRQDETDKRSFRIFLTDEGRYVSERIDEDVSNLFGGENPESDDLQQKAIEGFEAFRRLVELSERNKGLTNGVRRVDGAHSPTGKEN